MAETLPDTLPRAVAEMAIGGPDGSEEGADGGELEESPKTAGGQAEPANFVGAPDAESAAATGPGLAIAAKDAAGADGFMLEVFLIKSIQTAVAIESADDLAMRTGRMLEPLGQAPSIRPCRGKTIAAGPPRHASLEIVILQGRGSGGVVAGYD